MDNKTEFENFIKEVINKNSCWGCGKIFGMENPCRHVDGLMLCNNCAKRIEPFKSKEDKFEELMKIQIESLPSDRDFICEKSDREGFYYVQIIRGLSCRIPQVCSCCLGAAEKTESISFVEPCFSGTRKFYIDAPICKECLKHRKGFFRSAKKLGSPHTSKDESFMFCKADFVSANDKRYGDIKYNANSWLFGFTNYEYAVLFKKANGLRAGAVKFIESNI